MLPCRSSSLLPALAVDSPRSVIYWAAGGTDLWGHDWIYPMVDWGAAPLTAALTALGFALGGYCQQRG
jgi:hypothetical protein